jgi:hypothetical protein
MFTKNLYLYSTIQLFVQMLRFFYLPILAFVLFAPTLFAQTDCNFEFQKRKAMNLLPKGFFFTHNLPCYNENNSKKQIRATCLMFKNRTYCITVSRKEYEEAGIIATLYDDKQNVITSTLLSNKNYEKIFFECRNSALYYLQISFKDEKSYCGYVVVGVKY